MGPAADVVGAGVVVGSGVARVALEGTVVGIGGLVYEVKPRSLAAPVDVGEEAAVMVAAIPGWGRR